MNGKINKILSKAGILLAVLCIGCSFSQTCHAMENKGSLELECTFSEEDENIILGGDEYSVTKIADFDNGKFHILPAYSDFDCNWNLIISSEYHAKALQIAEYVLSDGGFDDRGTTDSGGKLLFDNMDTGLYLVIRTFTNDKNDEYVIDPFLVSIPQMIEDKVVFNVVVRPKYSIISDNESSKEEESSIPESSEPSRDISENSETFLTGDNTKEFGLLYMGTAFGSVITVIFILEKKNKV